MTTHRFYKVVPCQDGDLCISMDLTEMGPNDCLSVTFNTYWPRTSGSYTTMLREKSVPHHQQLHTVIRREVHKVAAEFHSKVVGMTDTSVLLADTRYWPDDTWTAMGVVSA
jgi:hypothetical protein